MILGNYLPAPFLRFCFSSLSFFRLDVSPPLVPSPTRHRIVFLPTLLHPPITRRSSLFELRSRFFRRLFARVPTSPTLFRVIFFYHLPPGIASHFCRGCSPARVPATMDEQPRPLSAAIGPCSLIKNNRRPRSSSLSPRRIRAIDCIISVGAIASTLAHLDARRKRPTFPGENDVPPRRNGTVYVDIDRRGRDRWSLEVITFDVRGI